MKPVEFAELEKTALDDELIYVARKARIQVIVIRLSHKALFFEVCISEGILNLTAFGSVGVYDWVTDTWPELDFAT